MMIMVGVMITMMVIIMMMTSSKVILLTDSKLPICGQSLIIGILKFMGLFHLLSSLLKILKKVTTFLIGFLRKRNCIKIKQKI